MSVKTKYPALQSRITVWRQLLVRPVVAVGITLIAVLSNLEWLRDHVLPLSLRTKLSFDALPQLSWQTWVAFTAMLIVALTLEAAFRQSREFHEQMRPSHVAFEPAIVIRYVCVKKQDNDSDEPWEFLCFRNVGDVTITNVSVEPIEVGIEIVHVRGPIPLLMPGKEARAECRNLDKHLYNLRRRQASWGDSLRVKLTLRCYDRTQTAKVTVDYVLTQDQHYDISFNRRQIGDSDFTAA